MNADRVIELAAKSHDELALLAAAWELDAKRYRNLRLECSQAYPSSKKWKRAIEVFFARYYEEWELDAAIDAAMKETTHEA